MKYLFILSLIVLLIFGHLNSKVTAQGDESVIIPDVPQVPAQPQKQPPPEETSQNPLTSLSGGQKEARSNNFCVKVGYPANDKPASCNQGAAIPGPGGEHPEAPPPNGDLQIEIQRQFGISMLGYDQQHLQWAWEKFWEVSNTNFNSLVRGSIIQTTTVSNTHQAACPNPNSPAVYAGQFGEESAFKHILIHELGHVIRNCAGRQGAQETAFMNAYKTEGGVSYYANNAPSCTGSDGASEDYAEMIAFYLNPGTPVASYLRCYPQSQNRYTEQEYPLHYKVARDVLGNY